MKLRAWRCDGLMELGGSQIVQSMIRALADLVKGECDADDRSHANDDGNGRRCHADRQGELP